ncbi:fucose isomerase [Paenibacillus sp. H1-7]|uniref:RbsD/FucU family protein n=1 Tax=Paenibacillus sp. H1-7 TaxID=2282849 RepID=UPI001EF83D49|nr:RbsD/FucU domain-containing protein [Paenibacillus sp. H1-7]ULL17056.1 fucose isomerase [Paenibacillus sp. H1-7]
MLRGIPPIISPQLMQALMEMGHGDEIVLADGNFPAVTLAKRLIRSDGHRITDVLGAIMPFFPLDYAVERPAAVMSLGEKDRQPDVWEQYRTLIRSSQPDFVDFDYVERFAFYSRAKEAFAVIATSDEAYKGNLILKKGVIRTPSIKEAER